MNKNKQINNNINIKFKKKKIRNEFFNLISIINNNI